MENRFYGVGEPLIQRQRDQGIDAAAALDLVKGLPQPQSVTTAVVFHLFGIRAEGDR